MGQMVQVNQIMSKRYHTVEMNSSVKEAAQTMSDLNVGFVVVIDEKREIRGVFSERDVMKKIVAPGLPPEHAKVENVMSSPVVTVEEWSDVLKAYQIMKRKHFRHLLIVDANKNPVGVISARDILDYLANAGALVDLLMK